MTVITNTIPSRAPLCTLEQAAKQLAISKRTLERLIAGGEFPRPLKLGRSSRVDPVDVDAYLAKLRQQRGPSAAH